MTSVPALTLNNGVQIPQLGFGVWQVPDDEVGAAVQTALEAGYRSIDTAAIYGNEEGTGRAIAAAGVAREDLFVTTKLWNSDQGYDTTLAAFDRSLGKLGLDYVDLYLIHWPTAGQDKYVDTWRAMERLYAEGRIRSIGVSNFHQHHLQRLFDETGTVPAVNQIELHPYLVQADLRKFGEQHDIRTESWSPLASGGDVLTDATVVATAGKYDRTPAQVILRWHVQLGCIVIPKSVTPARISQNIDIFDFELTPEEMTAIEALDRGHRTGPDPDVFGA
jgi:2,5-diketo-D-gluconate reductase A